MGSKRRFEHWVSPISHTFIEDTPAKHVVLDSDRAMCLEDGVAAPHLCCTLEADTDIQAMQLYYDHMGLGLYVPPQVRM